MSSITLVQEDITKLDTDCIVNAANEQLAAGGGVCGAIFKAAGHLKLAMACRKIGDCETGKAVITPGFNLKADYIIHAVGPKYTDGNHGEPVQLQSAYWDSLQLVVENGCHSIGFPLISAGIYGYPKEAAWDIAIRTCQDFVRTHADDPIDIVFAVRDPEILQLGKECLGCSM